MTFTPHGLNSSECLAPWGALHLKASIFRAKSPLITLGDLKTANCGRMQLFSSSLHRRIAAVYRAVQSYTQETLSIFYNQPKKKKEEEETAFRLPLRRRWLAVLKRWWCVCEKWKFILPKAAASSWRAKKIWRPGARWRTSSERQTRLAASNRFQALHCWRHLSARGTAACDACARGAKRLGDDDVATLLARCAFGLDAVCARHANWRCCIAWRKKKKARTKE